MPDTGWALKAIQSSSFKISYIPPSPRKPQHPKDSFDFFFFFFKQYSQFQRDPKEEIATRWDILKKKKPALYVEALKYIIQAEKMALILHE